MSSRQLKTKIKSVRNIKQITKAVQMVSATKMRRSQTVALNSRSYAKKSLLILSHLLNDSEKRDEGGFLWREPKRAEKTALIVITSDKGLAGNFNNAVLRKSWQWKETEEKEGREVEVVAVGKKARDFFKKRNSVITAEFLNFGDIITFEDTRPLGQWILDNFKDGRYRKIFICSNQFVSALVQKVEISQILPLKNETLQQVINSIVPKAGKYSELAGQDEKTEESRNISYLLEPTRGEIMENLAQDLIRVMAMYFIFESNASEHSSRMLAMKNATENAGRLQEELTLKLNKARQAGITQELTEISTAKEALTAN